MDSRTPDRALSPDVTALPEAIEFVRFCRMRRSVGWPELYDEMCAVAGRGLFRGWGADELGAHGIGFSLFDMPRLAVLVQRVIADERDGHVAPPPAIRPATPPAPVMGPPAPGEGASAPDGLAVGDQPGAALVSAGA